MMKHWKTESIFQIETQMDDVTGQEMGHLMDMLLSAGALDALSLPAVMKKGRPGFLLQVLCRKKDADALCEIIFDELPTLGVRLSAVKRRILSRRKKVLKTKYGVVRGKERQWRGRGEVIAEFDDVRQVARRLKKPLRLVRKNLNLL